jgi:predicted nuclease of predicted toxin-antitoxin system
VKLVIDMNLSPEWLTVLQRHGWDAVHSSSVANPHATDQEILAWAKAAGRVVFTHDLDFGAILAATRAEGPSVFQVRTQDVTPAHLGPLVAAALHTHEAALRDGALVTVDEARSRVRILPIAWRGRV